MGTNPDIQSPAALVLLVKKLSKKDKTLFNPFRWLAFRKKYLTKLLCILGHIECHYCKKDNLLINTKDKDQLATLDHVIPVSKGGALWDHRNLVPACFTCNNKKADKMPVEGNDVLPA